MNYTRCTTNKKGYFLSDCSIETILNLRSLKISLLLIIRLSMNNVITKMKNIVINTMKMIMLILIKNKYTTTIIIIITRKAVKIIIRIQGK